MNLPIHNICHSRINGPGCRLTIWVQGCKFNCKGCFNPETHAYTKDHMMDVEELARQINEENSIDGITISGGEPLDFPNEIKALLKLVDPKLTSIVYSGYQLEEIKKDRKLLEIVGLADLTIAGRYSNKLSHPYYGKKFILSSDRISIEYFKPKHQIEFVINSYTITKSGIFKNNH